MWKEKKRGKRKTWKEKDVEREGRETRKGWKEKEVEVKDVV